MSLPAAAQNKKYDQVVTLIEEGFDVNGVDQWNRTALMLASSVGNLQIIMYLLQRNADVNKVDNVGNTALTYASSKGHSQIVIELLRHNADIDATNQIKETPLYCAAKNGHLEAVKILLKYNANIKLLKNGESAMMIAIKQNHRVILRTLLDYEDIIDAAKNTQYKLVQDYLSPKTDINLTNDEYTSTLYLAMKKGYLGIIKELMLKTPTTNEEEGTTTQQLTNNA